MTDDLGDGKGAYVTDLVGLGHRTGDKAVEVVDLVEVGEVGADIVAPLEARAVHESRVGELFAGLDGLVHVAKAGGKDDVALFVLDELGDGGACFALGNAFDVLGGKPVVLLVELDAGDVMGVGKAQVADGAYVDKAGLDRAFCLCTVFLFAACKEPDRYDRQRDGAERVQFLHAIPPGIGRAIRRPY